MNINKEIKKYLLNYKLQNDFLIMPNIREILYFLITNIGMQYNFYFKQISNFEM